MGHLYCSIVFVLFVEPAYGERDIVVTTSVRCMYVRCTCVRAICVRPDLSGP